VVAALNPSPSFRGFGTQKEGDTHTHTQVLKEEEEEKKRKKCNEEEVGSLLDARLFAATTTREGWWLQRVAVDFITLFHHVLLLPIESSLLQQPRS